MEQIANSIAPEASTDERASSANPAGRDRSPAPAASGATPGSAPRSAAPPEPAPEAAALAPAAGFDPVPLRYRSDGLTPQKQREFVEALADCGLVGEAASRIQVSEQAIARVRRRPDARSFDLACDAALRIGARRILSVAFERAIEGTIKRHYYHGELKSEERVYDNRLLTYLIGRLGHLLEPSPRSEEVVEEWPAWMEAVEQGLPEPPAPPQEAQAQPAEEFGAEAEDNGPDGWEDGEGVWWTRYPPPAGFDGRAYGEPGDPDYERTLSPAEQAVVDADLAEERAQKIAHGIARRDRIFGFRGGIGAVGLPEFDEAPKRARRRSRRKAARAPKRPAAEPEVFSPREAETSETSETSGAFAWGGTAPGAQPPSPAPPVEPDAAGSGEAEPPPGPRATAL